MSKPLLGLILGAVLGLIDGVSAYAYPYPDVREQILTIIIGSVFKGLVTGVLAGYFAKKLNSLPLGIGFGLADDLEGLPAAVIADDGHRAPKLRGVDARSGFNQLRAGSPHTPIPELSSSLGQGRTVAARLRLGMLTPEVLERGINQRQALHCDVVWMGRNGPIWQVLDSFVFVDERSAH